MHLLAATQRWTDHMMDGWGWAMGLGWLIAIALVVLIVVAIIRLSDRGRDRDGESALDILKKRYARGEIDKQEYESRRRDLE